MNKNDLKKLPSGGAIVNEQGVTTDGSKGGVFVGKRHFEGGIQVNIEGGGKAEIEDFEPIIAPNSVNSNKKYTYKGKLKSAKEILSEINTEAGGVPIKKKGGELSTNSIKTHSQNEIKVKPSSVIITRNAFLDDTKKEFEGKKLSNKQILSKINEDGGGVGFDDIEIKEKGGKVSKETLLAPNGKQSNLTSEQWHLVRTPQFKKWFGDWENEPEYSSKVVDENGEPLVVYHGTKKYDRFNKFRKGAKGYVGGGIYFSSKKDVAKGYATYGSDVINLYECFLDIKDPFIVTGSVGTDDFLNKLYGKESVYKKRSSKQSFDTMIITSSDVNKLIDKGFDGVYWDTANEYVVYNSKQIKLADGTNTTFDYKNEDIRFKDGGNILLAPNGKPSNLNAQQWHLVRSKNFIDWFGDFLEAYETKDYSNVSKVLDRNFEPLICYHGTPPNYYKFTVFNIDNEGAFFTNKLSVAKRYASNFYRDELGVIKSVFLNIKNPEYIESVDFEHNGYFGSDANLKKRSQMPNGYINKDKVRLEAEKNGYDGFILENHSWGNKIEKSKQFAVFNSNQIKLADGTNTTFDSNSPDIRFKDGGKVNHEETYKKWKSLVNMSKSELENFYNSEEGKEAGLSSSEAAELGIHSGRESARWIMKMKDTPKDEWTPTMWDWANRQISFISRMKGNKGGLYDDKGNKTRKHTSLLIWGHNPEKFESGGEIEDVKTHSDLKKILDKAQIKNSVEISFKNNSHYWIIDGAYYRVSDHAKTKGSFGYDAYDESNDFRSYESFYNFLKENYDLTDLSIAEKEYKEKIESEIKYTDKYDGSYQTPDGKYYGNIEAAKNWMWLNYGKNKKEHGGEINNEQMKEFEMLKKQAQQDLYNPTIEDIKKEKELAELGIDIYAEKLYLDIANAGNENPHKKSKEFLKGFETENSEQGKPALKVGGVIDDGEVLEFDLSENEEQTDKEIFEQQFGKNNLI